MFKTFKRRRKTTPLVVILDNVKSMHNVWGQLSELLMLFGGEKHYSLWHYSETASQRNSKAALGATLR